MRVVILSLFAGVLAAEASPIGRVVELIEGLKSKIVADGAAEQEIYDKYACWCEKTTARKAKAIEDAKVLIEELSKSILELNGRLGTYSAEIAKLSKDVKDTTESIATAEEMRAKDHEEYIKKKGDLERALVNVKKAIDVLSGGTSGFTPAMVETRMLTVEAGVRAALHSYSSVSDKSATDLSAIKSFLSNPQGAMVQTKANPALGTYAPKSDVIQGILAQMKDDFEKELGTSAEEEATAAKDHTQLMETKRADLELLTVTLTKTKVNQGEDTKQLAEDKQEREETQLQLKTDEKFFDDTKDSCKAKAEMWSGRSRARTEELAAIDEAIGILSSPNATATFDSSATTFIQVSSRQMSPSRATAYDILKKTARASSSHSLRLATIASTVSTTGHFDSVLKDIDVMIANLRAEEKADIEHKDWCESEKSAAAAKNENLEYDKDQLAKKLERAEEQKKVLEDEVIATDSEKTDTIAAMNASLATRNEENEAFKQALKDDADAVKLIGMALESLSRVYGLIQQPEYKENPDTAPETFEGEYGGRQSEGGGILAILSMIKEDIEKEMKTASKEEAEALEAYTKEAKDSAATVKALEEKLVSLGQDIASKMKEIAALDGVLEDKSNSKTATDDYLEELKPNCDWVDTHFDSRMSARKAEMEGLQKAKAVLAGAGADEEVALVVGKQTVDQELQALDETEKSFTKSFLQRSHRK
jgi:predicted  nucleic acid-binding Zn-ribbon protein